MSCGAHCHGCKRQCVCTLHSCAAGMHQLQTGRGRAQMTLLYSNPALCAVIAWVIGTETVTAVGVAGVAATVAGVVFIAQPPFLFGQAAWDETRMA